MNGELANFRIIKYHKGWVVELEKPYWTLFGIKKKWVHFISTTGLPNEPWHFSSKEFAENNLMKRIELDTIINSRYC